MAPSPDTPTLTADQLQAIRDTDAASGDDLQFCPAAWQHRRQLLAYIDALVSDRQNDALAVAALSGMLEPYSGGTSDLHDLVARMHRAREIQQAVHAAEGT
jgi:hypothetical protein